jgi:hypothetical protein
VSAVFEHLVIVRWRDVDGLGHVNHAVFLTYLEEGRDAFYAQALGRDRHYVVARVEIDMRAEVRCADRRLRVRIEVERVGATSLSTAVRDVELENRSPDLLPCMPVSSDGVVLGLVTACRPVGSVRLRLARSGVGWGGCHLVCHLLSGLPAWGRVRNGGARDGVAPGPGTTAFGGVKAGVLCDLSLASSRPALPA